MDKALLQALQDRIPFRLARRLIVANGGPRGTSWNAIRDKLKAKRVDAKVDWAGLLTAYRQALVATDKSLTIYDLRPSDMGALRRAANAAKPASSNSFAKAFPFPLAESELASRQAGKAKLIGKVAMDGGTCLIFSWVQEAELREPLPPSQLPASLAGRYSVIWGVRILRRQTFDAVIIPATGTRVFVLVDAPQGMTASSRQAGHVVIKAAVDGLAGAKVLRKAVNLYPAIKPFYAATTGSITNFSYTTSTASEKRERMRGSGACLRTEIFHKTGMAALGGDVNAYEIELVWRLAEVQGYTPSPELSIQGTYRMTYEKDPIVSEALISKSATLKEVRFVIAELEKMLP